jgi:hypothetical protein
MLEPPHVGCYEDGGLLLGTCGGSKVERVLQAVVSEGWTDP